MAIADTITSMQTHTSNAYTMIGYGTDLTGINKNLANLSSTIFEAFLESLRNPDTLFTNLPKKSDSGSNITLNDTANAPMRIMLNATELTQAGTPTPDSPQEIHTISGSNTIVVCGKNLFDKATIESGKEISGGGIYTNSSWCVSDYIPVDYNQTYVKNINNGNDCIIYDKNKNKISANNRAFSSNKITITEQDAKYLRVNLPLSNLDTYQLEKGSTATTYEPYISQEAEVELSSKNLFDNNIGVKLNYSATGTKNTTGMRATQTTSGTYKYFTMILPNSSSLVGKTLTLSGVITPSANNIGRIGIFKIIKSTGLQDGSAIGTLEATGSITITMPSTLSDTYDFGLLFYANTNGTGNVNDYVDYTEVQLEEGSTALPYTEYGKNIEYCKIGNYEDKFIRSNDGTWQLEKNIGKVVLDGTETWALGSVFYATGVLPVDEQGLGGNKIYSNYFGWNTSDNYIAIPGSSANRTIWLKATQFATVSDLTTWLTTHNTDLYYVLATPTYTKITGTLASQLENVYQKMLSYTGQTNISQVNNDLSFNLSVSAIEEL